MHGFVEIEQHIAGVELADLEPLTILLVSTWHSVYRIVVVGGNEVLVQGGPFFSETDHNTATARRRWLFLAFPALAALALTVALVRPASAAARVIHFQSYLQIVQGESNPCSETGGSFLLRGVDHLAFELTLFDDGTFHSVSHQDAQLTGTDNQGNGTSGT
jgi:hypothetical protein